MKILVVTGASGGHIFPALGFLDTIKEKYKNIDTLLILPRACLNYNIPLEDGRVNYISVYPIKLSLDFKNLIAILKFFKGAFESIVILLTFRPDIVVGFGSLVSLPIIMFARLFGIRILIHEQNVIPGKANRFLARFADRIAISFSETKDYFKVSKIKVVLTGNPLRKDLSWIDKKKALDFFGFDNDKFTILIMGGSQGSQRINLSFLKAITTISDRSNFQLIHLSGLRDYDSLKNSYKDLKVNIRLFSFLESIAYAYSACDLVVSRAGATTIAEIIFFKLPAIIIPYPYAYKHQIANAKVLENIGSVIIIKDSELDSDILRERIEGLAKNSDRIKAMRAHYDSAHRLNVNDLLVNEALLTYSYKGEVN